MEKTNTVRLEVWGDFGLFTRPESKIERYSYPIMTPSAARGLLSSIYWKPGVVWEIFRIDVCSPIRYIPFRRNEIKSKVASNTTIKKWINGTEEPKPLFCDLDRTQRQSILVRDPKYVIHANMIAEDNSRIKQFERRAKKGQCFQQPYFGCREFPAFFSLSENLKPEKINLDIGYMLYDVFNPYVLKGKPSISFFDAKIVNGIMLVPNYFSEKVRKCTID